MNLPPSNHVIGLCPRCKEPVLELEAHKFVTTFHGAEKYERVMHLNCTAKQAVCETLAA